ncbi:MAG TPA: hypothetical protein VEQ84_16510 [Vicinamibacteria bacterium]|nr:hypothetical protein [Vicinamibacteria bacterium]
MTALANARVGLVAAELALSIKVFFLACGEGLGPVDLHRAMMQCPAVDGHWAVRR